jgi:hypothetical protein
MTHLYRKFRERNSMGHDERGIGTWVWEVARLRRPEPGNSGSGKKEPYRERGRLNKLQASAYRGKAGV